MTPQFYSYPIGSQKLFKLWKQICYPPICLNTCIIIIIISFITVFPGVLFVHQPGANHAPRASVTQVNHSVHTLSTFLRIRADPSMQIFWIFVILPWCFLPYYYYYNSFFIIISNFLFTYLSKNGKLKARFHASMIGF